MSKKIEIDFSVPVEKIDYETKKRGKRRRGEESTEPRKKKAPPYKRSKLVYSHGMTTDELVEWNAYHGIIEDEDAES